jgi:hypothetical protein
MTGELSREQAPRSQPLAAVPRAGHLIDGAYGATTTDPQTVRLFLDQGQMVDGDDGSRERI